MSVTFTQTDTNSSFSISTRCADAGVAKVPGTRVLKDAPEGGTAGSTEVSFTVNKTATDDTLEFITDAIVANSWSGGAGNEITFNLDVTTTNAQCDCTAIYACRVNSSGTSQGTYGSWTGTRTLSTAQVEQFTLTTTAQASTNQTDRIHFIVQCTATSAHGDEAIGLTPSQNIVCAGITELSNVTVTQTADSLTLTKFDATVQADVDTNVTQTAASLTLTKSDTSVNDEVNANATAEALTLTAFDVTVDVAFNVNQVPASLTLAGFDASVQADVDSNITTTAETLSFIKYDANVQADVDTNVSATLETLTLNAPAQTITRNAPRLWVAWF